MILDAVAEAEAAGCSREDACDAAGISSRTVARWKVSEGLGDQRQGPHHVPSNALSASERSRILDVVNSPEFRDVSPKQIVPRLADREEYIGSESTMYRVMNAEEQLVHREPTTPRQPRPIPSHVATGPNQVYSWDITYLPGVVRGTYFFLYLFMDVWSRKIVGWAVHLEQSEELAAALFVALCTAAGIDPRGIVLHADNGGPMKGATMLATLERLGVIPSFSRPSVSDDNAYSEALCSRPSSFALATPAASSPLRPRRRGWPYSSPGTTGSIATARFAT